MKQKQQLILTVSSQNPSLIAFGPSAATNNLATSHQPKKIDEQFLYNGVYNFINLNTIWWLKNSNFYSNLILRKNNTNFIDGKVLSVFSRIEQNRGPSFTKEFLNSERAKKEKHFFIGLEKKDKKLLSKKTGILEENIFVYNPPYISNLEFSKNEREKIISKIRKSKANIVWVCVGSPKQEILANRLYSFYKSIYFNIGAALDFLLEKKKECPKFFRILALEWFYRLITDFKYSKQKVKRSFIGIWYLVSGKVEVRR